MLTATSGSQRSPEESERETRILAALERMRPAIYQILWLFRLSPEDAEDVLQDLAVIALTQGDRAVNLESWLLGAAWNGCREFARKRAARRTQSLESCPDELAVQPEQIGLIGRLDLERGLKALPPRRRAALRLLAAGYRRSEIAPKVGYTESGIRQVILRDVARLSEHFAALDRRVPA